MNGKGYAGMTAPVGRSVERDVFVQGVLEIGYVKAKKWEAKRVLPALSSEESKRFKEKVLRGTLILREIWMTKVVGFSVPSQR